MENCCDSMMKYIVFLFNFVFFCTGVALIGLGTYIQINMHSYFDFLGDSYSSSSVVIIAVGVIIFVITFFGCCGACTENSCMMKTYGFLMMLILVAELGVAITIFVFRGKADDIINTNMKEGMKNYGKKDYEGVTKAWDAVQSDINCCGVSTYSEWFSYESSVPNTCCITNKNNCAISVTKDTPEDVAKKIIHTQGCYDKLKDEIKGNAVVVGGFGIALVVVQLIGIIIACCLSKNMAARNNYV